MTHPLSFSNKNISIFLYCPPPNVITFVDVKMQKYNMNQWNESEIYLKDHRENRSGWVSSDILFSNGNIPDIESKIRVLFQTEVGLKKLEKGWGFWKS